MTLKYDPHYHEDRHDDLRQELDALLAEFLKDQERPRLAGWQLLRLVQLLDMAELAPDEDDDAAVLPRTETLLPAIADCFIRRLAYEGHIYDLERCGPMFYPRAVLVFIEECRARYEPENMEVKRKVAEAIAQQDCIERRRGAWVERDRALKKVDAWLEGRGYDGKCSSQSDIVKHEETDEGREWTEQRALPFRTCH